MHFNQLKYYFSLVRVTPFLPILYYQGKHIKNTMPDLPAPEDTVVRKKTESYHILSIGESSVASIGANSQENGITGRLAELIRKNLKGDCSYEIVAKSGYTAAQVNEILIPKIQSEKADLIVIGLGANDSFKISSPKKWRKNVNSILEQLEKKFGRISVVFMHMPPILEFPIFTPLLKYFGHRQISIIKAELTEIIKSYDHVHFCSDELTTMGFIDKYHLKNKVIDDFYSDGVHPSELTYQYWANEIFEFIEQRELLLQHS